MRKNENSNYGRRPMPPSSVRVSPDFKFMSGETLTLEGGMGQRP